MWLLQVNTKEENTQKSNYVLLENTLALLISLTNSTVFFLSFSSLMPSSSWRNKHFPAHSFHCYQCECENPHYFFSFIMCVSLLLMQTTFWRLGKSPACNNCGDWIYTLVFHSSSCIFVGLSVTQWVPGAVCVVFLHMTEEQEGSCLLQTCRSDCRSH